MDQSVKKGKKAPMIVGTVLFLLILAGLFALSIPHALDLAKDIRTWGIAEIPAMLTTFEEDYSAAFPFRTDFVNLNGLMARAMQKRELNEVYRYKNGFLSIPLESYDPSPYAQSIAEFYQYVKQQSPETNLVYIQIPAKESFDEGDMPAGIANYSNEITGTMVRSLRNFGVPVLDLPEEMHTAGFNMETAFFPTDHHWLPETAFWVAGRTMEYLNETLGISYDPAVCDISNYQIDIYKRWALGSQGKRTGTLFAGVDDFSVIHPKFDTEMSVSIPSGAIQRHGTFYDVNIVQKAIDHRDYFGTITYTAYMGGDMPLVVHSNEQAVSDAQVLLLKESFSLPLQAFLSLHFQRLDVIDPRYYEGSVAAYIEETDPDIILICYNPWATEACFYDLGQYASERVEG